MHVAWRIVAPCVALALLSWSCGSDAPPLPTGASPLASHAEVGPCANDPAPAISGVGVTPSMLWPPNHKWVRVSVSYTASDAGGNLASTQLSVASDEPVNGRGDGNTAPDWIVLDARTVLLRAERSGLGDGRVYTITITARDACGHATTANAFVTVPHDRGRR